MKGLIIQLAGQEPSLQRQERRKSEREEDENVRIWLFYFGQALPRPCYAAAVNAPVKTNQGCQGRFCLLHTPRLHLYTQTQTCAVFLYRPLRSRARPLWVISLQQSFSALGNARGLWRSAASPPRRAFIHLRASADWTFSCGLKHK